MQKDLDGGKVDRKEGKILEKKIGKNSKRQKSQREICEREKKKKW